jgi:putative ABC transport system permease protein
MSHLFGLLQLAVRRLFSQPVLTACVLLGMTVAVAFASALPAFVNNSQLRVLRKLLLASTGRDSTALDSATRVAGSPLYVRYSYVAGLGGPMTMDELRELDQFMATRVQPRLILPLERAGSYVRTDRWQMWPMPGNRTGELYKTQELPMTYASMTAMNDVEKHIRMEDGVSLADAPKDGSIPVLVYRHFADKYGIQPGDTFLLTLRVNDTSPGAARGAIKRVEISARVSGVWAPINEDDDFWFVSPFSFSDGFLVTREIFEQQIAPLLPKPVDFVMHNFNLDDTQLRTELVESLILQINLLREEAFSKRQGISQTTNMSSVLTDYVKASREMTLLMVAFAAPLFVIVLYFIVLVSGMVIRRQEAELIILRSRGASIGDTLGLYAIQNTLTGLLALVIGMPLGYVISSFMTGIRTFLDFSGLIQLSVSDFLGAFSPQFLPFRFGIGAAVIATLTTMLPAAAASRTTIVLGSQERGRNMGKPLWQRMWLDVLLLIPVGYGYMQLEQLGSIGLFGRTISNENPLRDPVRYLLPMLLMTSIALLLARIFPLAMRLFAAVSQRLPTRLPLVTPLTLAARDLERSPKAYIGSMLLLIMSTGIATFGASTAKTLDGHLADSVYFVTGADLRLQEEAQSSKPRTAAGPGAPAQPPPDDGKPEIWSFLPVEDHLSIPGVEGYARIARLPVRPQVSRQIGDFSVLVMDWYEARSVMNKAFRPDYASQPLPDLLAGFASQPDAIYVTPLFMRLNNKSVGQPLQLGVNTTEGRVPVTYTIAGTYENFPTIIPKEDQYVFVADMQYTFEKIGKAVPYDVMLSLAPGTSGTAVSNRADEMGYMVKEEFDAQLLIEEQQRTPERQGLFGILTAGFFTSIALTIVGFVLYSVLSFRRRSIELGVLRTMGLSGVQMAAYLFISQLAIVVTGTAVGAGAGVLAGRLFIPFFQVTGKLVTEVPAFFIRMAWNELIAVCALIGAAFVIAITIMLVFLRRMRVFEAIKLGGEM